LGEPAGQRGAGEEDQAGDEHAPAAEQVRHAPAQQQEPAEGERVGVDDPRQVVGREVQRVTDAREGDVDDRSVEDDDELRRREEDERQPTPVRG